MADKAINTKGQRLYSVDNFVFQDRFRDDVEGILIPEGIVMMRAEKMMREIALDVHNDNPVVVPLMEGADDFYHKLFSNRHYTFPRTDLRLTVKSYEGTESTENIMFPNPNELDKLLETLKGNSRPMIIIEDIVDSGRTIGGLRKRLVKEGIDETRIKLAALISKPSRRLPDFNEMWIDYLGFVIDDYFIVGCGLDFDGRYRELPDICVLRPHVYEEIKRK
ncbi:phosphoribosyltransferase [Thermoproteota archaeon]